jgi:hypothetical protein
MGGTYRARERWEDNIKMNLKEKDMRMWTGSVWFMIGFNGGAM